MTLLTFKRWEFFSAMIGMFLAGSITGWGLHDISDESEKSVSKPVTVNLDPSTVADCVYEDMLSFEMQRDNYELKEGYEVCIHIDIVRDLPTPKEVQDEKEKDNS